MSSVSSKRELLGVLADQLGEALQHALALRRRQARPRRRLSNARTRAATTARSTSALSVEATLAITRPSIGLTQSKVAPRGRCDVLAVDEGLGRGRERFGALVPVDTEAFELPVRERPAQNVAGCLAVMISHALAPGVAEAVRDCAREIVGVARARARASRRPRSARCARDHHAALFAVVAQHVGAGVGARRVALVQDRHRAGSGACAATRRS